MTMKVCCRALHVKCRDTKRPYLRSKIYRQPVSDEQVSWDSDFGNVEYSPKDYTAKSILGKFWADHEDPCLYTYNEIDNAGINRKSSHGDYSFDSFGRPLNPFGRTGLRGRGVLGRWGPNHAADAIVSRKIDGEDGKQKLQFVAIVRSDTYDLAIPGGMVNPRESPLNASIREFYEEALSNSQLDKNSTIWKEGKLIYQGYVDDHRNTDNSWMETTCFNFHDSTGNIFNELELQAGSDAKFAKWVTVVNDLNLFASHNYLVKLFAKIHNVVID